MRFANRRWVIIDKDEVDSIDFSKVLQSSKDTLRYSVDGSKTFVKYEGSKPSFLSGKTEYNHTEILAILSANDGVWQKEKNDS
tara:strand:+ start:194 stop:442 length:249 start_codon:yes stop_codon:yes gene_type:complete